ncbi:MAG: class I SAM-dependent methyltransferase [Lentilitoribacter sp.]
MKQKAKFLERFRPHFGEVLFHDFTNDDFVSPKTITFFELIKPQVDKYFSGKKFRFLEVAPNKNFIAYKIMEAYDADGCLFDMSLQALLAGKKIAAKNGLDFDLKLSQGDFRNLPYENAEFDFVYMSGAIHHSFSPEKVAKEIARVTKPGGYFMLINEPVARSMSTYTYQGTRHGDGDKEEKFESKLEEAGIKGFVSYPIVGGRAESLFGMTENWSIPLQAYEELSKDYFELCQTTFLPNELSKIEQFIFESIDDEFEIIWKAVRSEYRRVKAEFDNHDTDRMNAFGFALPSEEALRSRLLQSFIESNQHKFVNCPPEKLKLFLFGGRIHCMYKRNSTQSSSELIDENSAGALSSDDYYCDLTKNNLPKLQQEEFLEECFSRDEWDLVLDGDNYSYINKSHSFSINLRENWKDVILCFRVYTIGIEEPYDVKLFNGTDLISSHNVIRNESWGDVIYCQSLNDKIEIVIEGFNGENVAGHLRLGSLKLYSIEDKTKV